jgi:hypothetical protein
MEMPLELSKARELDPTLSAHVVSETNTNPYAKAGLMLRQRSSGFAVGDGRHEAEVVPEVGIEPTRGVNPTGF